MSTASQVLGNFAASVHFEDLPHAVVRRAKDCIIDTVANSVYGSHMTPWANQLLAYAEQYGLDGPCRLPGHPGLRLRAPFAAFLNGAFAHAYEYDSIRDPSAGIHPGASIVPPVLALCEENRLSGKDAILGFVVGCEAAFRIASATLHSPETRGFHAPGLSGPYGAAAASARVLGLQAEEVTNALGIAGSLSGGILAFTRARQGAGVKKLHFARSAEAGLLAAKLAAAGHTGPENVLDGEMGFLSTYAPVSDASLLTASLGEEWETLRICLKRYPCHVNAQPAIEALRSMMSEFEFGGDDVAQLIIEGHEALTRLHGARNPQSLSAAQYSVPFCLSLALYLDPDDPSSFSDGALSDQRIRDACNNVVTLQVREQRGLEASARARGGYSAKMTRITVRLRDGTEFARDAHTFKGMPAMPFSRVDLRRKFSFLTAGILGAGKAELLFEWLDTLESQPIVDLQAAQVAGH